MKRWLQGSAIALCLSITLSCCAAQKYPRATVLTNETTASASLIWESYLQAMQNSQKDNRPVCLFFTGSDWCIWCIKMQQQILTTPDFISFAKDHLHMVELDFPQNPSQKNLDPQRYELKSQYDVKGFPQLVFIDEQGKELARMGFEFGGGAAYVNKIKASLSTRS
ncbi:disulfide reductase DsbH [Chlamydia sp. 17-3921]|uniref:disulfide reductase DsbH n=1 Tax=Chlamydia sp. 17-3921 TaxID=2675798 RepID=UPI001919FB14|nr:disulfide reductase DsbH [Chlamydia sp. 17-3921]